MPTTNETKYFEVGFGMDGADDLLGLTLNVYPCRCGETHRGDYALETYQHHNCFHDSPLLKVALDQVICVECGKSWQLEEANDD